MKIKGNTVGTPTPRANLTQTDPSKADYVLGREDFLKEGVDAAMSKAGEKFIPIGKQDFGNLNTVTADNAFAINYNNSATADNAFASGMSTTAGGHSSFSSGWKTEAQAKYSAAFNQETVAVADAIGSTTFGVRTVATGVSQLVCGQDNLGDDADKDSKFVVGCGKKSASTGVITKDTAFRVRKNGDSDFCGHRAMNLASGVAGNDAATVGQLNSSLQTAKAYTDTALTAHKNASNPHNITPAGIGAVGEKEFDAHKEEFDAHLEATNPHGITPAGIGAATSAELTAHESAQNPHGIGWDNLQGKPITFLGKAVFTPSVLEEGTWRITPSAEQFAHAKFMVITVNTTVTGNTFSVVVDMAQLPSALENQREYPFFWSSAGLSWIAVTRRYSWAIDLTFGAVAASAGCVPETVCMYF